MLGVAGIDPCRAEANALSIPPREYGRKAETQGIDGGPHKRWSMWFNSTQREEPYPGLNCRGHSTKVDFRKDLCRGAAWLSSARVVRCWVKSRNERNPCLLLPSRYGGHSEETAGDKPEEGGDDVKSAWPLCLGPHTCYNGRHKPSRYRKVELIGESRSQFGS